MSWSGLREWHRGLARAYEESVKETAERVTDRARELTPVQTGRLRDGWETEITGGGFSTGAVIKNETPYAAVVEFGTRSRPPVGMLTLALAEEEGPR